MKLDESGGKWRKWMNMDGNEAAVKQTYSDPPPPPPPPPSASYHPALIVCTMVTIKSSKMSSSIKLT